MSKIIYLQDYNKRKNRRGKHTQLERILHFKMEKKPTSMEVINQIRNDEDLKDDISQCAKKILEVFEIDADKQYVPIVKILNLLGIKTYKQKMKPDELSAYLSVDPRYYAKYGTTKIACVNEKDTDGHMRFALAHELAHYIFDYNEAKDPTFYSTYMKNSQDKDYKEDRANEFAANLLMPADIFIKKRMCFEKEEENSKPDVIARLADYFGVSTESILKRYIEVENIVEVQIEG
ncbi:MAG: ImmA/IrrE family metallo-endopeptidase [Lachnospiraceae bacterium]|nr:ImmA/IrrE family metallo-endopeptidase [Lachnospiraceae bacterium]MBP3458915.1 ImmA/IrrE family metallo-endopeptidase [Lachnospiraceae bacterium]